MSDNDREHTRTPGLAPHLRQEASRSRPELQSPGNGHGIGSRWVSHSFNL